MDRSKSPVRRRERGARHNEPVTTPFDRAAYPGVNAVTAIDNGKFAAYASRGSFVSLGASGNSIVPFGNMAFGAQGPSVSSGYMSGLAAGYLETSGGNVSKMEAYLSSNFGIKLSSGKPGR